MGSLHFQISSLASMDGEWADDVYSYPGRTLYDVPAEVGAIGKY
jgi:hypothetical protein